MKVWLYSTGVLLLAAFAGWYTNTIYDAGYNACLVVQHAKNQELSAKLEEQQTAINRMASAWLSTEPQIRTVTRTVIKENTKYVTDNPQCNITRGGIELFNTVGDPEYKQEGFHPALTEAQKREPSTITQRAFVTQCAEWGRLYNEVAPKYDVYVDIGKELER